MNGFLLIDKPEGISSFGVVAKVRKILTSIDGKKHKVGHGGTLDPAATGLLVLAIGKNTKLLDQFLQGPKSYQADIYIGATSTTDDKEGNITKISNIEPSERKNKKTLKQFEGEIMQTPPIFSALKIDGRRAYDLARKGKDVELKSRLVNVYSIELVSYEYPIVKINCDVGKGTYIRSLARDIGEELGTGAYLSNLRRTKLGNYKAEDALKVDELDPDNLIKNII